MKIRDKLSQYYKWTLDKKNTLYNLNMMLNSVTKLKLYYINILNLLLHSIVHWSYVEYNMRCLEYYIL